MASLEREPHGCPTAGIGPIRPKHLIWAHNATTRRGGRYSYAAGYLFRISTTFALAISIRFWIGLLVSSWRSTRLGLVAHDATVALPAPTGHPTGFVESRPPVSEKKPRAGLRKLTISQPLVDAFSVAVDMMRRNLEPIRKQVELWRQTECCHDRQISGRSLNRADPSFPN